MVRNIRWWHICLLVAGLLFLDSPAYAELQSTNYRLEESSIGTGGTLQSSSTNFTATSSAGVLGIGSAGSTNYQVAAGAPTTPDPTLTFIMNSANANFGSFSATTPAMTTASFSVSNYTSYGYVVQLFGTTPKNGNHSITAMSSTDSSQSGIEQFGVNLVANTSPSSVGANPTQGILGFGAPTANYATPNQYRFVSGEAIATSPKTSGLTTYTMSFLVNVDNLTPGGKYTSDQLLIVTGTF